MAQAGLGRWLVWLLSHEANALPMPIRLRLSTPWPIAPTQPLQRDPALASSFQTGMSLPEFLGSFGTQEQCAAAVAAARWPGGYACPRCSASVYWTVRHQGRELFQCGTFRHQTSLTAGTMFASTKLPLTTWFVAIYLLSQAKKGLSALALKRLFGVSYPTADASQGPARWPAAGSVDTDLRRQLQQALAHSPASERALPDNLRAPWRHVAGVSPVHR